MNDESLFLSKKSLFIRNSKIENELKSLHAHLTVAKEDSEREDIANDMVRLNNEKTKNWALIDEF